MSQRQLLLFITVLKYTIPMHTYILQLGQVMNEFCHVWVGSVDTLFLDTEQLDKTAPVCLGPCDIAATSFLMGSHSCLQNNNTKKKKHNMCNLQPCTLALQYTSARRDNKMGTVTKYSGTQLCLLPQSSRRFVLFHSLFSLQPPTLAMISLASNILLPVVAISFMLIY